MCKFWTGGAVSTVAILITAGLVSAQEVTLKSEDGTISLTGELLEFTSEGYRLQSAIGEVFISADKVECIGENCPVPEIIPSEFTISGASGLIGSLMPALLEGFSIEQDSNVVIEANPDQNWKAQLNAPDGANLATVELVPGGSAAGLAELLEDKTALAVTTRAIRKAEIDAFAGAEVGNLTQPGLENVLALDGLLIVTSQDNPVRAITEADTARIFSGEVTNWAEIGGNDAPVNLYVRSQGSGSGVVFNGLVMRPNGAKISDSATVISSDAEISDNVADDPNGVGFTSYSNVRNAKPLAIRGVCGIQTPATAFTIKTEEYPLTRRLYIYKTDRELPPVAGEFLEYATSPEAQQVIANIGFVDQAVSEVGVNGQGLRFVSAVLPSDAEVTFEQIREMMAELIAGDRLSITYRFEQGSARLDTRAQSDIVRLANLLADGDYGNKEIMLLGFTDSVGSGEVNQKLSLARAEQVRDALVAAAPAGSLADTPIRAIGYGELSPLGCNETTNGRFINRRVEVWTRDLIRSSQ